jgi:hypothetical protein
LRFRVLTPKYFIIKQKSQQMKKLFLVLAVASLGFVACNNEAENKTDSDTTTKVTGGDTVTTVTTQDTTVRNAGDTTIKKTVDTDTTKKN